MKITLPLPPNMANSTKPCRKCGVVKPLTEFRLSQSCLSGRGARCKPCTSADSVAYAKRNPEKKRKYLREYHARNPRTIQKWNLKKTYGITPEDWDALLLEQNGRCAICAEPFGTKKVDKPNVDHCHNSSRIRGLLCYRCNYMLGSARDNASILRSGATYLEVAL